MARREIPESVVVEGREFQVLDRDGFLMGRFISPHARYGVAADAGSEKLITDARGNSFLHQTGDPIVCQFEQSGLRDHEIEVAFSLFNFSGVPEGINPVTRIAVYDPEAAADSLDWDDETRKKVERKLWFASQDKPGEIAFVPSPRAQKPWPSYDSDSVEEILEFQKRLDFDPEVIRLYEVENDNRQEIIEAMWSLESRNERGSSVEGAFVVNA